MSEKNLAIVEAYYEAMNKKDLGKIEAMLHPEVCMISPLEELSGKEAMLKAIKGFISVLEKLEVRTRFYNDEQVMLVIDTQFPAPTGMVRTASLVEVQDGLISNVELFNDGRPIERLKNQIFSN